jgi:hypothetical protein
VWNASDYADAVARAHDSASDTECARPKNDTLAPFKFGGVTANPLAAPTPTMPAASASAVTCATPLIMTVIRHRTASRHSGEDHAVLGDIPEPWRK